MGNVDGGAGSENGESAGIINASGVFGAEMGLEPKTNKREHHMLAGSAREVIYPGANERRARASRIGDAEGVLGEGVQGTAGVIEEFERLVAGVDDGRGDPQLLQSVYIGVGRRGPDGQAGRSRHGDRRGNEGDERRGEHCESVRGGDCNEIAELNEPGLNSPPPSGITGERQLPDRHRGSVSVHEYMAGNSARNEGVC